tara:strand:- start:46 stop:588 length:543 start_codon:yes stop_codon:yes gene_type:complete
MPNNKASIRKEMKLLRRKNYVLDELAAWNAAKNFFKNFNNSSTVGVYWPMSFELDTRPLIKILLKTKTVCLPTIKENIMKFVEWKNSEVLYYNKLKFYQPNSDKNTIEPELILVPLLAFDTKGRRLGYGKGYYDKFYEKNKNKTFVGYGYAFQKINNLPSNYYDLKLNAIVTNDYIIDIF